MTQSLSFPVSFFPTSAAAPAPILPAGIDVDNLSGGTSPSNAAPDGKFCY
jgi:hypothetical protein